MSISRPDPAGFLTITENYAEQGGGLYNEGDLSVSNCELSNNYCRASGGGIYSYGGSVLITDSTISHNDAADNIAAGMMFVGGKVVVRTSRIISNYAGVDGNGGIINLADLKLFKCEINGNIGGGIYAGGNSRTTIIKCSINDNYGADWLGCGGIENYGDMTIRKTEIAGNENVYQRGGGILNFGTLRLFSSFIHHNRAEDVWGPFEFSGSGGGVGNFGEMLIYGSVISDNEAGFHGGGVFNAGTRLIVEMSEISDNTADLADWGGGGGGIQDQNGTCSVKNSVVFDNLPDNCWPDGLCGEDIATGIPE